MAAVAALLPWSATAGNRDSLWSFYKSQRFGCSAYYEALQGQEPWTFGYLKTHPADAPQDTDYVTVSLQHRTIRLRLPLDQIVPADIDGTPVRLQVFQIDGGPRDPISTSPVTFTIADRVSWHRLIANGAVLTVRLPEFSPVVIPITDGGRSALRSVEECDLRPGRPDYK